MKRIYKRFAKRTLLSILIVYLSFQSFATNYYISNAGNDSNSGKTNVLPWKTIAKLNASMAAFNAGDSILFKRGDSWTGSSIVIGKEGSNGNTIVIGAYGSGVKPVIQAAVNKACISVWNANRGYWTIENLDLRASGANDDYTYAMTILHNYWSGSDLGIVHGWVIQNCTSNAMFFVSGPNTTIRGNTFNGTGNSYNTGGAIVVRGVNGNHSLIENNTISNFKDRGVWVYRDADYPVIRNNIVYNIIADVDNAGMGINIDGYGIPVNNAIVYGNHIYDCAGVGISNENGYDAEYYNNLIERCAWSGLSIIFYDGNWQNPTNINFHHNIIVDCNWGFVTWNANTYTIANNVFYNGGFTDKIAFYIASASTYISNITYVNNIIAGSWIHAISIPDTKAIWTKFDNNIIVPIGSEVMSRGGSSLTLSQVQALGLMTSGITSNPQFVSAPNNFQIQSTSPAINAGINKGFSSDYLGNPIVGLPDIGAFEYGSSSMDNEKPIVTGFTVPSTSTMLSVSISAFTATDNTGVTGYLLTETSSVPSSGVTGWSATKPTTYVFTTVGTKTLYAWAKDAAGNVSASLQAKVILSTPAATSFTFTGPSTGNVNSASANFTVTPNNPYTGTITITPSDTGSAGLSAKVLTFSNSSTAQTFSFTPTVVGSITLTPTNNGSLTNPASLTYLTNAIVPRAPTSPVAIAGDAGASVTFSASINNGGSAITGYTVTSIPSGGIDVNAGSNLLTHTISGLTNGTSYTFTVKATNSVGSSVVSDVSNPVIPVAANVIIKQGEIIPSHFTTVWQGLNGLNHMNINVVSAILEDIPLSVDDEIAVFSGSACVGTSKLTKSIVPTDNTTFLTILASQNDGSSNGFTDSDTIVFKIWNNKTQKELQINSVVYHSDISTWKTNGRYSPASTAVVEIASYQVYTQSIELLKGYNMISTYVSVQNPNINNVTKTLLDQGNLIKLQDETGNSFENWGTYGGWINQVGSLEETEGYKIQVANNCTLQLTGRSIAMPFDISLITGWNIISYPRTDMINAMNVFQPLIDQNKLVKVQDEAGNSIENWGLFGGWKNGIGNLLPGKAYKVKLNTDAILTFQESYPKSVLVITKSEQTEYYHSSVEGNGTDHMNINITGLNNIGISVGDELAAFDGTVCVATTKITEANLLSGSACLASSFSTDNQNSNGFKVGDPIQITTWNKLSGNESKVNAEVITGQLKYEKNATVLVKMKSATIATAVINLNDIIKIDVFPNPCQGKVTVRFSEIPDANSRIEISDISGRKLISRLVSGTSEEFNLDSFTTGLYFVKSILGSTEFVQKLIVNK